MNISGDELGYGEVREHKSAEKPKTTRNGSNHLFNSQNKYSQSTYYQRSRKFINDSVSNTYGDVSSEQNKTLPTIQNQGNYEQKKIAFKSFRAMQLPAKKVLLKSRNTIVSESVESSERYNSKVLLEDKNPYINKPAHNSHTLSQVQRSNELMCP